MKLLSFDKKDSHSIAEVNLSGDWYRLNISKIDVPYKGELTSESIWNKKYKVWKKGRDVWDLGLDGIESEDKF